MVAGPLLLGAAIAGVCWLLLRALIGLGRAGSVLLGAQTDRDLSHLFVFIGSRRLLQITGAVLLTGAVIAYAAGIPWALLPLLLGALAVLPRLAVRVLRVRRQRRIAAQLPDALTLWAGLLRAGQGLIPALTQVAQRQTGPLGEELRLLLGQQRLGMSLDAVFDALRDRAAVPDLRLLAALLHTHRSLGGNLAESLARLAELSRGRLVMESRITALTAQGRLQGAIVGLLPLLLLAVLYVMEPAAMRMLHTTWQGWCALGVIIRLEAVGFVLIRKIVRIDV